MRGIVFRGSAFLFAAIVGCGSPATNLPGSGGAAGAGIGGPGGSGGGGGQPGAPALHACRDGEPITAARTHQLAADTQNFYWLAFDSMTGDALIQARSKQDPAVRTVTRIQPQITFLISGGTPPPVSADLLSPASLNGLVADDVDAYVYFRGDKQVWRVKKDGSEAVQSVSGPGISDLGFTRCDFGTDRLTATDVFDCRHNELFRMARAADGQATSIYKAPDGTQIDGYAVDSAYVYANGPYSTDQHLAQLLRITTATGASAQVGQMIQGLVPDAIFLIGQNLVFDSLFVATDAPDLQTESEWAKRQGSYRIGLGETTPTKIGDDHFNLVNGATHDAAYVYTLLGDQMIIRIPVAGGTTQTVVDCHEAAGGADDIRFGELLVLDNDSVYVRTDDGYWRYSK